jgi:hypothetical protein
MNVLPWLLDWPPSPATVGVFLVVTAFSAGTLVVFGAVTSERPDEGVTIESVDLDVRVNDETDLPETGDSTVQTCLGVGVPGDSVAVLGDVTANVPPNPGRGWAGGRRTVVVVGIDGIEETTSQVVDGAGRVRTSVFWVLADDETLVVGETATLRVRVRSEGSTLARTNRTVTVEDGSRSYECEGSSALGSRGATGTPPLPASAVPVPG